MCPLCAAQVCCLPQARVEVLPFLNKREAMTGVAIVPDHAELLSFHSRTRRMSSLSSSTEEDSSTASSASSTHEAASGLGGSASAYSGNSGSFPEGAAQPQESLVRPAVSLVKLKAGKLRSALQSLSCLRAATSSRAQADPGAMASWSLTSTSQYSSGVLEEGSTGPATLEAVDSPASSVSATPLASEASTPAGSLGDTQPACSRLSATLGGSHGEAEEDASISIAPYDGGAICAGIDLAELAATRVFPSGAGGSPAREAAEGASSGRSVPGEGPAAESLGQPAMGAATGMDMDHAALAKQMIAWINRPAPNNECYWQVMAKAEADTEAWLQLTGLAAAIAAQRPSVS